MTIKALAPWFGGKRTLASDIIRQLGKHTQYFEPFCGSMAPLLEKEPSQKETVNDLHGDLINLARVCQGMETGPQLYERLQRAIMAAAILQEARESLDTPIGDLNETAPSLEHVERAFWYFVASWMGRNGTAGTKRLDYQIAVRWTCGGGSPTVRWKHAASSVPWFHQRLQNVVILNRDAFSILDRFEDVPQTAIYADPPYLHESRVHGEYLHDFHVVEPVHSLFERRSGRDPHEQLAGLLRGYKRARIVVSYYDSPRVRQLYEGWTFIEKTMNKQLHAQNGRGARKTEAPEVLIVNGPAY